MCLRDLMSGRTPEEFTPDVMVLMWNVVTHKSFEEIRHISEREFAIFTPLISQIFISMMYKGMF
jgi:hypothetical protein